MNDPLEINLESQIIISTHVVDKDVLYYLTFLFQVCDLNPQKTCKFQTKLVPKLKPTHECTVIPQEICQLKFTTPREEPVPFMSKWCIDPNAEVTPDTTYDENDAAADPIGPEVTESSRPDALYGAPGGGDQPEYQDYEEEDLSIPPPPPVEDEPFEQTESTYEEPVYDDFDDSAASALDTGYGSPAPSAPRGGPRRNGGNAGPRRGNRPKGNRRKNGNTSKIHTYISDSCDDSNNLQIWPPKFFSFNGPKSCSDQPKSFYIILGPIWHIAIEIVGGPI